MKRSILLFTAFSGVLYLSLSSYSSGPSTSAGHVAVSGCGNGCHGAKSTATTPTITVTDGGSPVSDNLYHSGRTYKITVSGTNATKTQFGYQFSALSGSNITAGTYSNISAGSKQSNASASIKVVEHSARINAGANTFTASFDWTAPASGTGPVTMALSVNAVNGDNSTSGDQYNSTTLTMNESSTSVGTIAKSIASVYPNPASEQLTVQLETNGNTVLHLFDGSGRLVYHNSTNDATIRINTTAFAKGMYYLQVINNGNKQVLPITVQ